MHISIFAILSIAFVSVLASPVQIETCDGQALSVLRRSGTGPGSILPRTEASEQDESAVKALFNSGLVPPTESDKQSVTTAGTRAGFVPKPNIFEAGKYGVEALEKMCQTVRQSRRAAGLNKYNNIPEKDWIRGKPEDDFWEFNYKDGESFWVVIKWTSKDEETRQKILEKIATHLKLANELSIGNRIHWSIATEGGRSVYYIKVGTNRRWMSGTQVLKAVAVKKGQSEFLAYSRERTRALASIVAKVFLPDTPSDWVYGAMEDQKDVFALYV